MTPSRLRYCGSAPPWRGFGDVRDGSPRPASSSGSAVTATWLPGSGGSAGSAEARLAGASSWGDPQTRRIFSASGNGPQGIGFDFGSDAIGLIRGVDESDVIGDHAVVANLDYRFPLMRIDRGLGTLPFFTRVVHAALFVDAGNAWHDSFRADDLVYSVGAELSLDAVVGYVLPLTFTGGTAWASQNRGWAVFGRVGRAF